MYAVRFTENAERDLKKLDKSIQDRIINVLERIRIRPQDFVEKLVGESGFKLRVGDYRIFLDIFNDDLVILVIEVGHRRNIYKK